MGRKAKPATLHLIDGNKAKLSKSVLETRAENEARLHTGTDKVKPPGWLSNEAKKEFRRVVKELMKTNLVTNLDVDMLAVYCDAYVSYQKCEELIRQEGLIVEYTNKAGETNNIPHPLLTKKKQLFDQMRSIALEFGLTPSARAKLALPKQEPQEKTPFERLFGSV